MVYFENKTRNHAKGFRIQKHLLLANESCVLVLQNCCATDFRKTVIRFVARQVRRRHANSECPGAWPLSSRSRGAPPTEHADAPHPPQNIAALESKPRRRATGQRAQQSILHTACTPQEPIIRETPSRPPEICTSLIPFPLTGKAHFSALNHGGNYEKIEDLRTRDAYCVRNGRLPGPRCLLKRAH